jgi:hypothetical protein
MRHRAAHDFSDTTVAPGSFSALIDMPSKASLARWAAVDLFSRQTLSKPFTSENKAEARFK